MAEQIKSITIVGGGTAGWLAATILNRYTKVEPKVADDLTITLIESPNIPTVGVGEATVPGMARTLQGTGIGEREFFKRCNASFKLGVMFSNWNVDTDGKPINFMNVFSQPSVLDGVPTSTHFSQFGGGEFDYAQLIGPNKDLAEACKAPRTAGSKDYESAAGFAYHLDAGRFAEMLRDTCIERGVVHVLDDVEGVNLDERGFVSSLSLKERGDHPVELVIDCTGFKGLIINEALKEPFVSYSKFLANDRALAVQIPHGDPSKMEAMTRSTALGAGWTWRVPLYHRVGTGYVFSSAHRTDEEARDEFMASLGPEAEGFEPRVIPMRVGRTRRPWVKNCVAIGLAGGFIEPLESTAIHMTDMAIRWLLTYFPTKDFPEPLRDRFNKVSIDLYDEVRDFICLHYALGNRTDDPYWIDTREALELPDTLAENLELWQHTLPAEADVGLASLFPTSVYLQVMLGKRVYETGFGEGKFPVSDKLDRTRWGQYTEVARNRVGQIMAECMDHRTYLTKARGEEEAKAAFAAPFSSGGATVPLPGAAAPVTAPLQIKTPAPAQDTFEKEDASIL